MRINLAKLQAKDLIWEKRNREHIKKHNLSPRQVEQILLDTNKVAVKAHSGRVALIGRCGKRVLTAVLNKDGKKFYIVTARDASKIDRQIYRENL